ncbi:hypothetical protein PGT21_000955 [Puccinia graminis f. sp. tritici]|uniref:Uncharacterized protein n=1 Tax=Puccinia graminis f. sp. tritici TaxID=56615 RepID=A0A5B0MB21_PUCGR|nr:hypothetical protein PGT21_000955 [Puccinia graminis f. sp. tritici]
MAFNICVGPSLHSTPGAEFGSIPLCGALPLARMAESNLRPSFPTPYPQPPSHRGDQATDKQPATKPKGTKQPTNNQPQNPIEPQTRCPVTIYHNHSIFPDVPLSCTKQPTEPT